SLKGLDSLLSIVQMPGGVPVGTLAIGRPGAINAALLAVSILGLKHPQYRQAYEEFRLNQTARVLVDRTLKLSEKSPKSTHLGASGIATLGVFDRNLRYSAARWSRKQTVLVLLLVFDCSISDYENEVDDE